ncbi:hypothetical protein VP01_1173g3 [Puccinia sorghi]|uniref:Uncharacterized protein n=1 Tax=Puccinia sorghi TaxID=27349 RepID=A0A0L6VR62_9BASI|nr:hypothetical protein VP01_1173g3 [Puccinia sorghi]
MHYSSHASKAGNLPVARADRRQSSSRSSNWVLIQNHSLSLYIVLISLLLILQHGASASDHGHAAMSRRTLYDITIPNPSPSGTGPNSSSASKPAVLNSKPTLTGTQTKSNPNSPGPGSTINSTSPGTGLASNPTPTGSKSKLNSIPPRKQTSVDPGSTGAVLATTSSPTSNTSNSIQSSKGTGSAASSSPSGTKSNSSKPAGKNSTDKSGPTCGFHQEMLPNATTGAKPTSRTSKDHGILTPDCYNALGHILHMKGGVSMMGMSGPPKRKTCGTCRLEIEASNSKELFVPLDIVMFGNSQDKLGGLNGLLKSCQQRVSPSLFSLHKLTEPPLHEVGGQVILKAGGRLSTTIRIDVSKSTHNHNCSVPAQKS